MESIRDIYYALLDSYEFHYNKVIEDAATKDVKFVLPCIGEISVDTPLSKLLFLPIFRRLKDVKQLAHTHIYLPGAVHTRYEHSLGVMAISLKVLEKLRGTLKEKVDIDIDDCDSMILGIATLLHDIGHASWGHALDGLAGIVSEYFTEFLGGKLILSDIRKLDITIASYLLEHNEQLTMFFDNVANKIKERCGKELKPEYLRKIVWLIISEEWYLENYIEDLGNEWAKKIRLFQTILGSPEGIGGVNTDRLDWIVRDSHHTYVKMYVPNIDKDLEKVDEIVKRVIGDDDISNSIDIHDSDTPRVLLKGSDAKAISSLREKLYAHVYEGFERAFTDSLLTRLVYSALKILYHAGRNLSGPSIILKVITSYLLQPDHDLINFTRKILDIANNTDLANYNIVEPVEQQFIKNSSRLVKYIDSIDMIIHSIRSQKPGDLYISTFNLHLNQYIASIPSFDVGIVSISCGIYGELIDRALKATLKAEPKGGSNVDKKHVLSIHNNLFLGSRITLFKRLEVADIESTIHSEVSGSYGNIDGIAGFYVLPNYYAFRKLWDTYWREIRGELTSIDKLINLMKGQNLKDYPILIILTELRKGPHRMIKLEDLMETSAATALDKLLMHTTAILQQHLSPISKLPKGSRKLVTGSRLGTF